jgi:hypothetical protein
MSDTYDNTEESLSESFKGETAQAIYTRLESLRWVPLERARDCAALTLPGLIPNQWINDQTAIPEPYQSVGARGVNNLASKLLLALFPPGQPFFRLKLVDNLAEELGEQASNVEAALVKVENSITDKVEQAHTRPKIAEVLKHLIVGGSALLHIPEPEKFRFFRLDQFVIVRDAMDRPIRCVIKETTVAGAINHEVAEACRLQQKDEVASIDVYTTIVWNYTTKKVTHHQEINGVKVPDSDGERPLDKSEWIPLRWHAVPGRNYGRGHVEEYLGDLRSLEGLSEAIVQFAQAASKIVMLVHPNSTTSADDINRAESGDAVVGSKADIDMMQLEKQQDFQTAMTVAERLEQRISYAFLIQTGTTRQAERVTAEEIRANAEELENTLGGVYTVLSEELQLPLVRRFLAYMTESRQIPALPKAALRPVIVTGFEALGRNHSLNKLKAYFADMSQTLGPQVVAQRANVDEIAKRFALGYSIESPEELWISNADFQKQQQQQVAQQAMIKAAPNAAGPLVEHALGGSGGS